MEPKLTQEQTLQRKLNQSLLQAIQILQFSGIELIEYIKEIAKENPLIEEVNYDYDIAQYKSANYNEVAVGEINQTELSMYEQLRQQLYTLDISETMEPIVHFGIDSLNEDGYLDIELKMWAEECSTTVNLVEEALVKIQSLEPSGIGARSISECILLQLKHTSVYKPFVESLLTEHLDWIADENVNAIIEEYDTIEEDVYAILDQIKRCHPKPGQLLAVKRPEYVIPEASIYKEDGEWRISFYKWNSPTIELNRSYEGLTNLEKDAANYLKEKYKQIDWLNQAITYRTNTLELVIRKLVEKQQLFFEHGSFMLEPLTLREVAQELDVHISTISRTISNKYVQTKQGVVPIKFFLQSGVTQRNGKKTAAFAIKQLIHELIQHENKQKPLSDELIRIRLYEEFGITIARRTVMKYREQLQIPASIKRK
ncbi:RNA polymerase factor sigma-54 [Virgibacillus byunsanensis]|uniref:RNA polymerase factor sigma-54 n=1 Tax=Virgibacillus byunsanensis TaxID=570945 RepID=A0ABW3LL79_9BACI